MNLLLQISLFFFCTAFAYAQKAPIKSTENCITPSLLMATNKARGQTEIRWSMAQPKMTKYSLQYRKKDSGTAWETQESYQPFTLLAGLKDDTTYEYRVGAVCSTVAQTNNQEDSFVYSGVQSFTTNTKRKENENPQCGIAPNIDLTNQEQLKTLLGTNEVFMAGDFPVTVTQASGNGSYTGTGYIQVPYLADTRLKVVFNNIQLNTDKKLIAGVVETTYDITEKNILSVDEILAEAVNLGIAVKELIKIVSTGKVLTEKDLEPIKEIQKSLPKNPTSETEKKQTQIVAKVLEKCTPVSSSGKQSVLNNFWLIDEDCKESLTELDQNTTLLVAEKKEEVEKENEKSIVGGKCKCKGNFNIVIDGVNNVPSYKGDFPSPFQIINYTPSKDEPLKHRIYIPDSQIRQWIKQAAEYHGIPHEMIAVIIQQENAPNSSKFRQLLQFGERTITTKAAEIDRILGDIIPDKIADGSSGLMNMRRPTLTNTINFTKNNYCKELMPKDVANRIGYFFDTNIDVGVQGLDWRADLYYGAAHIRQLIDNLLGKCGSGKLTLEQAQKVFTSYNGSGPVANKYGKDALELLKNAMSGKAKLYFYEK